MANSRKRKSGGSGNPSKTRRPAGRARRPVAAHHPAKLNSVSDAPESGEPQEQGRTRGRVIEDATTDPRAAHRNEPDDTANEAWESGRQKAMD